MSRDMTDPRVCTRPGTPSAHAVRAVKRTWAEEPDTSWVGQVERACGSTNKMLSPSTPLSVSPVTMSQHFSPPFPPPAPRQGRSASPGAHRERRGQSVKSLLRVATPNHEYQTWGG